MTDGGVEDVYVKVFGSEEPELECGEDCCKTSGKKSSTK